MTSSLSLRDYEVTSWNRFHNHSSRAVASRVLSHRRLRSDVANSLDCPTPSCNISHINVYPFVSVLSVYQYFCLSFHFLPVCLCIFVYLSISVSLSASVSLYVCLTAFLYVSLCICLSIGLSFHLSVSVCLIPCQCLREGVSAAPQPRQGRPEATTD